MQNISHPDEVENKNISTNCHSSAASKFLVKENLYIGLLFASKPFVQLFANLAVGPVVDRIGFDFPMLLGNLIMMVSGLSKYNFDEVRPLERSGAE